MHARADFYLKSICSICAATFLILSLSLHVFLPLLLLTTIRPSLSFFTFSLYTSFVLSVHYSSLLFFLSTSLPLPASRWVEPINLSDSSNARNPVGIMAEMPKHSGKTRLFLLCLFHERLTFRMWKVFT